MHAIFLALLLSQPRVSTPVDDLSGEATGRASRQFRGTAARQCIAAIPGPPLVADWLESFSAIAPVRTANFARSPACANDAYRVQFPAIAGGTESVLYYGLCAAGARTASIYAKGTSGSGTFDILINLGGGNFACGTCAFNPNSFTLCSVSGTVASSGNFAFGSEASLAACGTGGRPAADVLIYGAKCQ